MRLSVMMATTVAMLCIGGVALADEQFSTCGEATCPPTPVVAPHDRWAPALGGNWRLGFGMDVGVPSGIAVGFVLQPRFDWVSAKLSFTENVLSPGARGSLTFDPVAGFSHVPVGVLADFQVGFAGMGWLPGHADKLPSFGYDYVNTYLGLRLGRATGFHWNFLVGPTWMTASTTNFQSVVGKSTSGLTVGNPSFTGWITPTFETGFVVVW